MALSIIDKYRYLFTRRRKRTCLVGTFLMSVLFVTYQFLIHYVVSKDDPTENPVDIHEKLIRGAHTAERAFYAPVSGKFRCFKSGEIIDFEKVNDDYCDCADSTDEPGTNACPDGVFYCSNVSYNKKYPKMIPSSKVNDGICDCCDGSEEYGENRVLNHFERTLQTKMKHFLVPCPNVC